MFFRPARMQLNKLPSLQRCDPDLQSRDNLRRRELRIRRFHDREDGGRTTHLNSARSEGYSRKYR